MRCPTCGHQNSDLATRCSACGSALPDFNADDTAQREALRDASSPDIDDDTAAASDDTARRAAVSHERPASTQADEPQAREVAHAARRLVVSRRKKLGGFFKSHEMALGIGLAVGVVAIMVAVWLALNVTNTPSAEQIERDMRERLPSYEYVGGAFGSDLTLELGSVRVTGCEATRTPEGMEAAGGVGATAFAVSAELLYEGDGLQVTRNAGATYVRGNDGWELAGELSDQGTSLQPRGGVNHDKVIANMDTILDAIGSVDGVQARDLYAFGEFQVSGNDFEEDPDHDTSTDDVVIHCVKYNEFYLYEGDVTAHFAFESGEWSLRSAEGDASMTTRSYAPLVGTWSGGMVGHDALGSNCYGAQDHVMTVTIDSVGDSSAGSGQVQGTVSVLAHYHERLESDANATNGDEMLESVAFSGNISTDYDDELGSSLVLSCTTLGSPDGDLSFKLGFGTDTDPSSVVARVTTTHDYEELVWLFVPHQTTARFTDTYLLGRA